MFHSFWLAAHACAKKVYLQGNPQIALIHFFIKDPFTGQVTHDFQTPFTLQHRIGGKVPV